MAISPQKDNEVSGPSYRSNLEYPKPAFSIIPPPLQYNIDYMDYELELDINIHHSTIMIIPPPRDGSLQYLNYESELECPHPMTIIITPPSRNTLIEYENYDSSAVDAPYPPSTRVSPPRGPPTLYINDAPDLVSRYPSTTDGSPPPEAPIPFINQPSRVGAGHQPRRNDVRPIQPHPPSSLSQQPPSTHQPNATSSTARPQATRQQLTPSQSPSPDPIPNPNNDNSTNGSPVLASHRQQARHKRTILRRISEDRLLATRNRSNNTRFQFRVIVEGRTTQMLEMYIGQHVVEEVEEEVRAQYRSEDPDPAGVVVVEQDVDDANSDEMEIDDDGDDDDSDSTEDSWYQRRMNRHVEIVHGGGGWTVGVDGDDWSGVAASEEGGLAAMSRYDGEDELDMDMVSEEVERSHVSRESSLDH